MKMKYALVDGERREPQPGLSAKCPLCENPVIAKCGDIRVKHWAHKGKLNCDHWWENRTEWHVAWQDKFPREWQEYPQHDTMGEKHIADVRTNHGLVIEFQHSRLKPKERDSRERFYKNMVWVVDGTRLEKDFLRFRKGIGGLTTTKRNGAFLVRNPQLCFPLDWLNSSVQVFFDFQGVQLTDPPDALRQPLWCLHPNRVDGNAVVTTMSRELFVEIATKGPQVRPAPAPVTVINRQPRVQRVIIDANLLRALFPQDYKKLRRMPPRQRSWRL
jgi:hypothetical protein